jgi:hypothetical protein
MRVEHIEFITTEKELGEKYTPVPLPPPYSSQEVTCDLTQSS